MRKSYDMIDVFKLFFAAGVVALHTGFLNDFPFQLSFLGTVLWSRLAVPFFFAASGFFFAEKIRLLQQSSEKHTVLKKYLQRTVILYLIWTTLKLLYSILRGLLQGRSLFKIVLTDMKNFMMLNDHLYWYLQVLIIVVLILGLFFATERKIKTVLLLSAICYCSMILLQYLKLFTTFSFVAMMNQFLNQNAYIVRLIRGFMFISIGCFISFSNIKIRRSILWFLFALGVLIFVGEIYCLMSTGKAEIEFAYYMAFPLMIFSFLQLCLSSKFTLKHAKLCRNLSVLTYMTHYMLRGIVHPLASISSFVYFLGTLGLSLGVGYLIIRLSEKWKVFRYLY